MTKPKFDAYRKPIPRHLNGVFDKRKSLDEIGSLIRRARYLLGKLHKHPALDRLDYDKTTNVLDLALILITQCRPHTLCHACHGVLQDPPCLACNGLGWLNHKLNRLADMASDSAVPFVPPPDTSPATPDTSWRKRAAADDTRSPQNS